MILGDGADAMTPGAGGGAGGSILLEAPHLLGEHWILLSFDAQKVFLKQYACFCWNVVLCFDCSINIFFQK